MYQDKIPQNSSNRNAHEIDYKIFGEEMQFVEIELIRRKVLLQKQVLL